MNRDDRERMENGLPQDAGDPSLPPFEEQKEPEIPEEVLRRRQDKVKNFSLHMEEEAPPPPPKEKKKKKKERPAVPDEDDDDDYDDRRGMGAGKALLYFGFILSLSLLFASVILLGAKDFLAVGKLDREVTVSIPKNASMQQVAEILKEEGVIDFSSFFRLYNKIRPPKKALQSGEFDLNSAMSYDTIIKSLQTVPPPPQVIVKLTFAEGTTLRGIAKQLAEKKVCTEEDFFDALHSTDFGYGFLSDIPDDPLRWERMEGYLFPDTYEFFEGHNVNSAIDKFLTAFNSKFTDEMKERAKELDMTVDDVVILASVIQKEAGNVKDMGMVSSVFHNRLNNWKSPLLQSDPTIAYVEKSIKPYLDEPNQEMYDAYNTYVRKGLPAGPICSPGEAALKAALYPEESDYYYFVTDKETGEFYYASTLEEHNANIKKAGIVVPK